jgi:hypothetical protein
MRKWKGEKKKKMGRWEVEKVGTEGGRGMLRLRNLDFGLIGGKESDSYLGHPGENGFAFHRASGFTQNFAHS